LNFICCQFDTTSRSKIDKLKMSGAANRKSKNKKAQKKTAPSDTSAQSNSTLNPMTAHSSSSGGGGTGSKSSTSMHVNQKGSPQQESGKKPTSLGPETPAPSTTSDSITAIAGSGQKNGDVGEEEDEDGGGNSSVLNDSTMCSSSVYSEDVSHIWDMSPADRYSVPHTTSAIKHTNPSIAAGATTGTGDQHSAKNLTHSFDMFKTSAAGVEKAEEDSNIWRDVIPATAVTGTGAGAGAEAGTGPPAVVAEMVRGEEEEEEEPHTTGDTPSASLNSGKVATVTASSIRPPSSAAASSLASIVLLVVTSIASSLTPLLRQLSSYSYSTCTAIYYTTVGSSSNANTPPTPTPTTTPTSLAVSSPVARLFQLLICNKGSICAGVGSGLIWLLRAYWWLVVTLPLLLLHGAVWVTLQTSLVTLGLLLRHCSYSSSSSATAATATADKLTVPQT